MKRAMIDLETLSVENDAAIIAIGTVIFDEKDIIGRQELLLDPRFVPGHRSNSTLEWWGQQDPAVFKKMMSGTLMAVEACAELGAFLDSHKPVDEVWANAPQFDLIILRRLFKVCKMEFPIHFRNERDFRTLIQLARSHAVRVNDAYRGRIAHSAVSDAEAQAKAVQIVLRTLRFIV